MDVSARVEQSLAAGLHRAAAGAPPRLIAAMQHAVFPGGARIRPRLSLAVAQACGTTLWHMPLAAACAIEYLHCASLVHDDLPCFDDAAIRRGKPSVHAAFGQPLAVLAGDALIVLAFETLALGASAVPARLAALVRIVGASRRQPRRDRRGPGVGIGAGDRYGAVPSRQDGGAVCRRDDGRGRGSRRRG